MHVLRIALFLLAAFSALVALFYAVENWRGQRALDQSRRELAAKGEQLEWADWLPKPVPEESNFFKAPGMTALFVMTGGLDSLRSGSASSPWPPQPEGYSKGYPFSMADLKQLPVQSNRPEEKSLASLQQWFQQHEFLLQQLESAARRPQAQLEPPEVPFGGPMINFVNLRKVAQWLASKAEVDLLAGHPEQAERTLALVARLVEITRDHRPPLLVQCMIGVAVAGLHVWVIQNGLTDHLWPEPQLAACQAQLQRMELLASLRDTLRAERAGSSHLLEHWPRARLVEMYSRDAKWSSVSLFVRLSPRGWLLQNRAVGNRVIQDFVESFDPTGQAVTPNKIRPEWMEEFDSRRPYHYLAARAVPNLERATQAAARTQSFIRQAAIACALERHRLAQGEYPDSLAALVPRFLDRVPADVIAGEGFRFRRLADGRYLLYSVGWNGADDGGVTAKNDAGQTEVEFGDWVWNLKG